MNRERESNAGQVGEITIQSFQHLIRQMYYEKDVARGVSGTFLWLMEEVGELSSALRQQEADRQDQPDEETRLTRRENLKQEFADVLAWLVTLANVVEVDLTGAINEKYGSGCPGCQQFVCLCPDVEKP